MTDHTDSSVADTDADTDLQEEVGHLQFDFDDGEGSINSATTVAELQHILDNYASNRNFKKDWLLLVASRMAELHNNEIAAVPSSGFRPVEDGEVRALKFNEIKSGAGTAIAFCDLIWGLRGGVSIDTRGWMLCANADSELYLVPPRKSRQGNEAAAEDSEAGRYALFTRGERSDKRISMGNGRSRAMPAWEVVLCEQIRKQLMEPEETPDNIEISIFLDEVEAQAESLVAKSVETEAKGGNRFAALLKGKAAALKAGGSRGRGGRMTPEEQAQTEAKLLASIDQTKAD